MQKLLFSLSIIAIGLIIGYIIQKLVIAGKIKADKSLSKQRKTLQRITLLILNPIATMGAIWIISFDNMRIVLIPVIGLIATVSGGIIALIFGKLLKLKPKQAGSFFICGSIFNTGAIGALIVFIFLGEEAFALVPMYQLFEPILYYVIWFPIAKSFSPNIQQEEKSKKLIKIITDPFVLVSLISILIGLILNFSQIQRPEFYSTINAIIIPLISLLLLTSIGMTMKFNKIKNYIKPSIVMSVLKYILVPIVGTSLAYFLGFGEINNGLPLKVILILSSMPVGFAAMVPPSIYDLDIDLANATWLVTTALLIIIIPIQMFLISFM